MPAADSACLSAREWLSANRDGESFSDAAAQEHLVACHACDAWAASLDRLTPRLRLRVTGSPELTGPALARWDHEAANGVDRQTTTARIVLGVSGVGALVLALLGILDVPGYVAKAGPHLGMELYSFEAALGVGFLFAAVRPERYWRSLLPVTAVVATLSMFPLATHLSQAAVDPLMEASHLPILAGLAGLLLLFDASRRRARPHDSRYPERLAAGSPTPG